MIADKIATDVAEPAIFVRGPVIKQLGIAAVLENPHLVVPNGAFYLLAGANGAGKSTLLRCLINVERSQGELRVAGLDPRREGERVRAVVGYVSEGVESRDRTLTASRWFKERAAYYRDWDHSYAADLGRRMGVALERRLSTLSKGQARAVQLVAALAFRPRILLLDEPTDGLDLATRDALLEILSEHIAQTGCTTVLATHQIHEIDCLADHVGVLKTGRLIAQGPRESVRRSVNLFSAMGPDDWNGPEGLQGVLRRERLGREVQWIVRGDAAEIAERFAASSGGPAQINPLSLSETLSYLMRETPQ